MNLDPKIASAFRASALPFPYIAALTVPNKQNEYTKTKKRGSVKGNARTIPQRANNLYLGGKLARGKRGLSSLR